ARALPALKPNQPNQSSPAPSRTNGTLCGRNACRAKSLRGPITIAATSAATPPLTCTTVPPAKSRPPIFASHPPPPTHSPLAPAASDPVRDRRVDDNRPERDEEEVGAEAHALDDRGRDERGRDDRERALIRHEQHVRDRALRLEPDIAQEET